MGDRKLTEYSSREQKKLQRYLESLERREKGKGAGPSEETKGKTAQEPTKAKAKPKSKPKPVSKKRKSKPKQPKKKHDLSKYLVVQAGINRTNR